MMKKTLILVSLMLWTIPAHGQIILSCFSPAPSKTATVTPTCTPTPVAFTPTRTPTGAASGLVGFLPAVPAARDIVVDSVTNRAYVSSNEFGLTVVDVTSTSAPIVRGATNRPVFGDRVAQSGTLAVVTGGLTSGIALSVIDVTTPTNPLTRGSLAGGMLGVAMSGTVAYGLLNVAGNPGHVDLVAVSLSNPAAPVIVSQQLVGASALNVRVFGSFVYVTTGTQLRIYDISTPASPAFQSAFASPSNAVDVAVSGSFAYTVGSTVTQVINVSNSMSPVFVTSIAVFGGAISVSGNRLAIVDGTNLKLVDITTPSSPSQVSNTYGFNAQRVATSGTTVFVTAVTLDPGTGTAGVHIVAMSAPTVLLSTVYDIFGNNNAVSVSGSLAGVSASNSGGVRFVDVTTATSPQRAGSLPGTWVGIAVNGSFAFGLQSVSGNPPTLRLTSISLANPASPSIISQSTVLPGTSQDIKVSGSFVYIAGGSAGFLVYNVSNPSAPSPAATLNTFVANRIAIDGSTAYVSSTSTVQIVNITNPSSPSLVGPGVNVAAGNLTAASGKLYTTDGSTAFKITDVTNPFAPQLLSTTTNPFGVQGVAVIGTTLAVTAPGDHNSGGAWLYNVLNANAPSFIQHVAVPGLSNAVTASTLVYLGDSNATVDIVQP